MTQMLTQSPTTETIADLLDRLGGVAPRRVRFQPYPATEQDVLKAEGALDKRLYELIDGVLVEKVMGYEESALAMLLGHFLLDFVLPRNLGIVAGEAGMLRLWPGRVRIPDVSFVSWDRLPAHEYPKAPIPDLAPDLAVEVLSESNTAGEMALKLRDYFAAGVRLVWYVDPEAHTVRVFTGVDQSVLLGASDTLDGGDVVPGFRLPLEQLFSTPR